MSEQGKRGNRGQSLEQGSRIDGLSEPRFGILGNDGCGVESVRLSEPGANWLEPEDSSPSLQPWGFAGGEAISENPITANLLGESSTASILLELRFNSSDISNYQVIQLFRRGDGYAVTLQGFDGLIPGQLSEKPAPKDDCVKLLARLAALRMPISNLDYNCSLCGFYDLGIDLPMSCCRSRWDSVSPGWEPLSQFAWDFARLVSKQFGLLLFY